MGGQGQRPQQPGWGSFVNVSVPCDGATHMLGVSNYLPNWPGSGTYDVRVVATVSATPSWRMGIYRDGALRGDGQAWGLVATAGGFAAGAATLSLRADALEAVVDPGGSAHSLDVGLSCTVAGGATQTIKVQTLSTYWPP